MRQLSRGLDQFGGDVAGAVGHPEVDEQLCHLLGDLVEVRARCRDGRVESVERTLWLESRTTTCPPSRRGCRAVT